MLHTTSQPTRGVQTSMRSALAILGFILALIPAAVRAIDRPLFITGYEYLPTLPFNTAEHVLYNALLLAVFFTLFVIVTKTYDLPEESLLVLIATPAVLTTLVTASNQLQLGIIGLLALLYHKHSLPLTLLTLAAVMIEPLMLIFTPITLFMLFLNKQRFLFISLTTLLAAVAYFNLPAIQLSTGFAELGLLGGASIFITLLALAGIVLQWSKDAYPHLLIASTVIFFGLLFADIRLLAAIATAITGGYALKTLLTTEWRLENIRNASILLVVCGLLFATMVTTSETTRTTPDANTQELIHFLTHMEDPVFALTTHHPLLAWHEVTLYHTDEQAILTSRNIDVTREYLPPLVVLETGDQATNLRFLIEFTDDFVKLLENDDWTVYAFSYD